MMTFRFLNKIINHTHDLKFGGGRGVCGKGADMKRKEERRRYEERKEKVRRNEKGKEGRRR